MKSTVKIYKTFGCEISTFSQFSQPPRHKFAIEVQEMTETSLRGRNRSDDKTIQRQSSQANTTDFDASLLDVEEEVEFHFLSEGPTLSPSLPTLVRSAASGSSGTLSIIPPLVFFSISLPQRDSSMSPSLPWRLPIGHRPAGRRPSNAR